jgi:hypothetical protein
MELDQHLNMSHKEWIAKMIVGMTAGDLSCIVAR